MAKGSGGTRSGGASGRSGGTNQPRMTIQKGTPEYKEAQGLAKALKLNADESPSYGWYNLSDSERWDDSQERLENALAQVNKHGNDFEKSVAQSVAKTIRPYGKGGKVAFMSEKQAWVIAKSLVETHVNVKKEVFGKFGKYYAVD